MFEWKVIQVGCRAKKHAFTDCIYREPEIRTRLSGVNNGHERSNVKGMRNKMNMI